VLSVPRSQEKFLEKKDFSQPPACFSQQVKKSTKIETDKD
jgi:hypothetical protein